jgi:NAD(P)-dependent dehydrogenase (short-subunit alcohol dehydrogenase family)
MGILAGKVAVITGSTRGLGFAIAQAYAREGAAVVLSGRSVEAVEQALATLRQQGGHIIGQATDVSELAQVKELAALARETYGSLDIWVNNAGQSDVFGPATLVDPLRYKRVLETNIFGTYHGSLVALNCFAAQGKGKLINILGRGDKGLAPYQSAYGSSKSWVRSFTLTLAKENKSNAGLGIYAFNPGLMDTDLVRHVEVVQGYGEKLKGFGTILRMWANAPAVPAEKAVWLASSATDGKTGLEINLLGPRKILGGLAREQGRKLFRQPGPDGDITLTTVEPYRLLETDERETGAHLRS